MATIQNIINANSVTPLPTSRGGSGVSSPTAHGILVGEGSSPFNSVVLGAGNVLIGTTSSDPVAASLTAGTGISISSLSGSISISTTSAPTGWVDQTTTPVTMTANTGYTSDAGATQIVLTLPTAANIGDKVEINGKGSGLWQIAQAASQQIFYGDVSTTAGTGGSITSTLQYDCITLRALTSGATSTWVVVSAVGNHSVV
jgi:hypothetical protein